MGFIGFFCVAFVIISGMIFPVLTEKAWFWAVFFAGAFFVTLAREE